MEKRAILFFQPFGAKGRGAFQKVKLAVPCVNFRLSIIQDSDGFPGHQNNDHYVSHATCQTFLQHSGLW